MTPPHATTADRTLRRGAAPPMPRRVSGGAGTIPHRTAEPLILRAGRRGRRVADSRFLDRMVRGRLWVPVIAVALMGIVFIQVSMLKLNSGIGRAVETVQTLERQNTVLRSQVSNLERGERIEAAARWMGMRVPTAGGFHYLQAGVPGAAERAVNGMTPPSAEALARATAPITATTTTATTAATEQPPATTGTAIEAAG